MDQYVDLCRSFGLPVWIAALLRSAKRLHGDVSCRRKVYRLLQRKLLFHNVGVKQGTFHRPTYVYPEELKRLIRCVFPEGICNYQDPSHENVVFVTVEDLQNVPIH